MTLLVFSRGHVGGNAKSKLGGFCTANEHNTQHNTNRWNNARSADITRGLRDEQVPFGVQHCGCKLFVGIGQTTNEK